LQRALLEAGPQYSFNFGESIVCDRISCVESVTDQLSDLEIEELSWTLVDQVLESLKILKNMFTVQLSRS
jgi:hypothetical protein